MEHDQGWRLGNWNTFRENCGLKGGRPHTDLLFLQPSLLKHCFAQSELSVLFGFSWLYQEPNKSAGWESAHDSYCKFILRDQSKTKISHEKTPTIYHLLHLTMACLIYLSIYLEINPVMTGLVEIMTQHEKWDFSCLNSHRHRLGVWQEVETARTDRGGYSRSRPFKLQAWGF